MALRDLSRFSEQVSCYPDLGALLRSRAPEGIITVDHQGVPLDLLHRPVDARTTVVVLHTALSDRMTTIPVFSGSGVLSDLHVNLIAIADPTLALDPSLKLSWYLGSRRQPRLQEDVVTLVCHLLDVQAADNVIFFGASGGGFAALEMSARIPGSVALALNPQIILEAYNDAATLAYGRAAWEAGDLTSARRALAAAGVADVREVYRPDHLNHVAYVQNLGDSHHLYRHLAPFLKHVDGSDRVHVLLENWGTGHVPPPKEVTARLLSGLVHSEGRWTVALSEHDFLTGPSADDVIRVRKERLG